MAARTRRVTKSQIDELSKVVRHPGFQQMMHDIEEAPASQRPQVAQRLATRQALSKRGVPLPDDFRITLRWFEDADGANTLAESVLPPAMGRRPSETLARPTICASVGFIVCASIGW